MPKFDASTIGGRIEYDFTAWDGPSGIVPEPSRRAVKEFMDNVQKDLKEKVGIDADISSPEDIAAAVDEIDDDEMFEKTAQHMIDAVAKVCAGNPTREDLDRLPYRVFMGFFGYLVGELMSPEVQRTATNSSRRLRSV